MELNESFQKTTGISQMEENSHDNITAVMNSTLDTLNELIENMIAVEFDENLCSELLNAIALTKTLDNLE